MTLRVLVAIAVISAARVHRLAVDARAEEALLADARGLHRASRLAADFHRNGQACGVVVAIGQRAEARASLSNRAELAITLETFVAHTLARASAGRRALGIHVAAVASRVEARVDGRAELAVAFISGLASAVDFSDSSHGAVSLNRARAADFAEVGHRAVDTVASVALHALASALTGPHVHTLSITRAVAVVCVAVVDHVTVNTVALVPLPAFASVVIGAGGDATSSTLAVTATIGNVAAVDGGAGDAVSLETLDALAAVGARVQVQALRMDRAAAIVDLTGVDSLAALEVRHLDQVRVHADTSLLRHADVIAVALHLDLS